MILPPDPTTDPGFQEIPVIEAAKIVDTPFASFADFEVEFELIGSILRRGRVYDDITATLNEDIFHSSVCRDIFNAMGKVRQHGLVLDVVTVGDQLDRDGFLKTIVFELFSGRAALSAIREKGNPKNVMSYVEIVRDYWAKRQLDYLSSALSTQSRNGRRAADIISDARIKFDELDIANGKVSNKTYPSEKLASALYDHVDLAAQGKLKGCPTGFIDLDKLVTMMAEMLILIAGRPGQGKSALLDTIVLQAASDYGKKVGVFSLEMSHTQVTARLASQLSGIPVDRILRGKIEDGEWTLLTQAIEIIEKLPISINDQPAIKVPELRTEARRMIRDMGGLDLIALDYIQLMGSVGRYKNRNEEIGEMTKGLKAVAMELEVPILAAAQMSRAVEQRSEKRPVLSDLRESGDLENDSDVVMFIYRPDQYEKDTDKPNVTELIVAKHRNGPVGSIELIFRGAMAKFENACTKRFAPNEPQWQNRADMGD